MGLFEIKNVDQQFYQEKLNDFLPDKMIDIHTHLWSSRFETPQRQSSKRTVTWPSRVAKENRLEDLQETYRLMFPNQTVTPLMFTTIVEPPCLDEANAYVQQAGQTAHYPTLMMAHPTWSAETLAEKLQKGRFLGIKVYLSYADAKLSGDEITIFDFLPRHQLAVLNEHKQIAMLHIPRSGRLKDPTNLAQLLEIERDFPDVQLIVAHVGRAYCLEDIGDAFEQLAPTKKMKFDFSANTNSEVFYRLIQTVGPERILFGSDLPITRMRMKRLTEDGLYINCVPRGLYGDVSADKNMRELDSPQADQLSFFLYEEIAAFKEAAQRSSLNRTAIQHIFYDNAAAMLKQAGFNWEK